MAPCDFVPSRGFQCLIGYLVSEEVFFVQGAGKVHHVTSPVVEHYKFAAHCARNQLCSHVGLRSHRTCDAGMSALGQKRTYAPQQGMSALPPIATAKSGHKRG